ncbi:hypothetical protein PMAYCL1PPCAC_28447, partial [Pristionchus mayeri]
SMVLLLPLLLWVGSSITQLTEAGKILVYSPSISASHLISNGRIAKTLAKAGHDVTIFIPEYTSGLADFKNVQHPNIKIVHMRNISSAFDVYMEASESGFEEAEFTSVAIRYGFEDALLATCDAILHRREELEFLREARFDVAFTEQLDTCGMGVLRYVGIENILWISTTQLMEANSYRLGVPQPTSYVPTIEENDNNDVMDFWQRSHNLYMYLLAITIHSYGVEGTTAIFRRHLGRDFPHTGDIAANSSLCFVNSDEQFDLPRPSIWKNIYVGGLGIEEPRPFDPKLAAIMKKGKKGVILMSLGTIAPFHALPEKAQKEVIAVFERFADYHFILKISKEDDSTAKLIAHLSNVDLLEWLPQTDLLGHPRLRLFIMHGGLNGLMEAAHRAVPVVVIPFFADQFRNGRLAEKRGMGKSILKKQLNSRTLGSAVNELLTNPSYKQSAERISQLLKTRPFSPEERLVKWTEFAITNGVLSHLNVEGARLSTIVYFNLDVIGVALLCLAIVIYGVAKGTKFILVGPVQRRRDGKENKVKKQ